MEFKEYYTADTKPIQHPIYCCKVCHYYKRVNYTRSVIQLCEKHNEQVHAMQMCGYFAPNMFAVRSVQATFPCNNKTYVSILPKLVDKDEE